MTVTVIGVDGGTLAPGGAELIAKAALVVGGRRHLARLAAGAPRTVELGPPDEALRQLPEYAGDKALRDAVVLASGDPGFFGVLRALRAAGIAVTVLPALSSVQRVTALAGRPWDDVTVVSAHGRDIGPALNVCRTHRPVAVLTGPGAGPAELGAGLRGWRRNLVVAEDLGGPDEAVSTVEATAAADRRWREPNVVLCLPESDPMPERSWVAGGLGVPPENGWALAEDDFAHRDGMVTKAEVRALALARLAPRPGTLVWDIGAGSGAVGVECGRLGAAVIAVERDPGQCVRIVANAARYGVDVRLEDGEAPEVLADLPAPDAVFVGGGGPNVVRACAEVGAARIVVALASLDRVALSGDALRAGGYQVDGCQLTSARLVDLPGGSSRLTGTNPVLLLWGTR
ncbi:MAG TPA: precorrin-6y C5,15-methyltransferase (decarboxylating) subunit CbiE, partial [Pseudonocardiaceae bacterium]|nr:precorrin-6y C5,15-methyltransferase (decarboxylating) subunit CbiE [Pseudonocardiaceae bacterium]